MPVSCGVGIASTAYAWARQAAACNCRPGFGVLRRPARREHHQRVVQSLDRVSRHDIPHAVFGVAAGYLILDERSAGLLVAVSAVDAAPVRSRIPSPRPHSQPPRAELLLRSHLVQV